MGLNGFGLEFLDPIDTPICGAGDPDGPMGRHHLIVFGDPDNPTGKLRLF